MSVRTPMQWSAVAEQERTPDSLLRFVRRLAHQRREAPELGWGVSTLIENEPEALFARRSDWQGSTVFVVHNLSAEPVAAELDLGEDVWASTTCSSCATTTSRAGACASSSTRTATCGCGPCGERVLVRWRSAPPRRLLPHRGESVAAGALPLRGRPRRALPRIRPVFPHPIPGSSEEPRPRLRAAGPRPNGRSLPSPRCGSLRRAAPHTQSGRRKTTTGRPLPAARLSSRSTAGPRRR